MSLPRVLLTNPIDPEVARHLAAHFDLHIAGATDAASLKSASSDASFIVVRAPLPEDLFACAPQLRGVVRHGAGLDMIPVHAASRHGVAVANVPAVNAVSVAEYAVAQMLNLARHLTHINATLRNTSWAAARQLADGASDLQGKTVAIVGMGAIGQALARICALGFGMRVLGIRRSPAPDNNLLHYVTLVQALPQADYLVLACPLSDSTRGLIGATELACMKPGARLINVARGPVADEAALAAALRSGALAGAALDVFTTQPLPTSSPLLGLSNVLLSPHLAGITQESMRRMSEGVASQLLEMQDGHLPRHFVNPEAQEAILARWSTLSQS
ncbi:D-isomer specific 2-hydroxyacid dehydrogenase family protein [Polaromonas sp.]|uniref:NAD(P)-dependent oxidoreductase n=1 Tax=Polaromonas sp. TaxID=1869339 RepID=UPI00272A4640|nr:NAD(P)-dependent oxidoreductase [Polaromonas sp.]MDP1886600.1 NAD(P)-dependent oxidoreductase [Polaromonas sp.]MDP3225005.1 NAD(P)-dependent oxidoreductase [Rubrivivax sp.]